MQLEKKITFNGRVLVARQLTVKQVRELIAYDYEVSEDERILEEMFAELMPFAVLRTSTGMEAADLLADGVTQNDLDQLCGEVLELNPSLARLLKRRASTLAEVSSFLATQNR